MDIYEYCPTYTSKTVTLRLLNQEDTLELLNCYSDEKALPLFNADNCKGDTFFYNTVEKMQKAVDFWEFSYRDRWFVRMTILHNETKEKIGTIEMFNRGKMENYGSHGILRLDLMSAYETEEIIKEILQIAEKNFYKEFGVDWIFTKAVDLAKARRKILMERDYQEIKSFPFPDYYGKKGTLMEYVVTTGKDQRFEKLCQILDENLNELVGGEKQREKYIQYNGLAAIHDVVLAMDGESAIGCGSFKEYAPDVAEIKRVFVHKESRGLGIGGQIMKTLEEIAKEKGYTKLILETGAPLLDAMKLYLSLGFKVIDNYGQYKDMPESICMEKNL